MIKKGLIIWLTRMAKELINKKGYYITLLIKKDENFNTYFKIIIVYSLYIINIWKFIFSYFFNKLINLKA